MTPSATAIWRELLCNLLADGEPSEQDSAGAAFRGRTSYELLAHTTVWPMEDPVILCPARKLGFKFIAAEAAWILSGSNRLDEIVPYAPKLAELSDDGVFMSGAYGPPFAEQLPYVLQTLARDRRSRQAVTVSWRQRPGAWRDVPCTISLQFLIRPDPTPVIGADRLHVIATMRSSDVWYGVPYDVHFFAMAGAFVALHLRDRIGTLLPGNVYLTAGSQHLYKLDREAATKCVYTQVKDDQDTVQLARRADELAGLRPLDFDQFDRPQALIDHLWAIARRDGKQIADGWLAETLL